jgi:3-oxoacyl-[acyl-carrier protein] reductase
MLERGSGRVLTVTSGLGYIPTPQTSAYGSSKAGVIHFTRILATELLGTGVTANAVDPRLVGTALSTEFPEMRAGGAGPQWGPRPQGPWEPARLLAWLCGPVGSWINGQVVDIYDPIVRGLLQLPVPVTFS